MHFDGDDSQFCRVCGSDGKIDSNSLIEWFILIFDSVSYRLRINIEIYIIGHHTSVSYYVLIFSLWAFVTHFQCWDKYSGQSI